YPHAIDAKAASRRCRTFRRAWRVQQSDFRCDGRPRHFQRRHRCQRAETDVARQVDCRPGLTVRNIRQRSDPLNATTHMNRMAEFEAHNLAEDGDVLVISGVSGMSNMGGISSMTGKRQGERGAIVMGGVRDVRHSRSIDYPVWDSEITPVTGKWRLETVEINGEIQMGDVRVNPGDLVIADDTGVCFVPRADIMRVLELCEKKKKAEGTR